MAPRKILKYTCSFLLLLYALNGSAQKQEWYGLSVGADLSRIVVPFIDSTRFGWEVSGDMELLKDLFGVVEIGSQTTHLKKENYNYNSNGGYTRIGVDYNYMKHLDPTSHDKMFIGLRYGFTTFYHDAENIVITDDVWGNNTNGNVARNWLTANWIEIATGMRAHLFNNFFLGWSARFKIKLWEGKDAQMAIYSIPGFGLDYGNSNFGINYSLYYKIPLMKKKNSLKSNANKKVVESTKVTPLK